MSPTLQSLGIDQLSKEQRIELVLEIWNSIASESSESLLTPNQREELQKRAAEVDANPNDVVPWEQIQVNLKSRLKG
ncbi:MAG: addiction module protein [Zavarzinella sp.]